MDEITPKKKKNIPAMITGIVAVFAILILVLVLSPLRSGVTGQATGTQVIVTPSLIDANSCKADGVCETNSVSASAYSNFYGGVRLFGGNHIESAKIGFGGNVTQQTLTVDSDGAIFSRQVKYSNLAGNLSAYACISSDGTLFRSSIPCTYVITDASAASNSISSGGATESSLVIKDPYTDEIIDCHCCTWKDCPGTGKYLDCSGCKSAFCAKISVACKGT